MVCTLTLSEMFEVKYVVERKSNRNTIPSSLTAAEESAFRFFVHSK